MPIPTTSPGSICEVSNGYSDSSQIIGEPHRDGIAAASTYGQRGIMTAVPKDTLLGLTRNTRIAKPPRKAANQTLERWRRLESAREPDASLGRDSSDRKAGAPGARAE